MKVFLTRTIEWKIPTVYGGYHIQESRGFIPAILLRESDGRFCCLSDDEDSNELIKGATHAFIEWLVDRELLRDRSTSVEELTRCSS